MSAFTTPEEGEQQQGQEGQGRQGAQYTPPATQADLNRIVSERLAREREKYKDYDDLRQKAGQFDALEERNKTDLQKASERAAAAERRAAEAEQKALKADVAMAKGVPTNLLSGATKAEMEASADALLEFRGQGAGQTNGGNKTVPGLTPGEEQSKKVRREAGEAEAERRFGKQQ